MLGLSLGGLFSGDMGGGFDPRGGGLLDMAPAMQMGGGMPMSLQTLATGVSPMMMGGGMGSNGMGMMGGLLSMFMQRKQQEELMKQRDEIIDKLINAGAFGINSPAMQVGQQLPTAVAPTTVAPSVIRPY